MMRRLSDTAQRAKLSQLVEVGSLGTTNLDNLNTSLPLDTIPNKVLTEKDFAPARIMIAAQAFNKKMIAGHVSPNWGILQSY